MGTAATTLTANQPAAVFYLRFRVNPYETLGTGGGAMVPPQVDIAVTLGSDGVLITAPQASIAVNLFRMRLDSGATDGDSWAFRPHGANRNTLYGLMGADFQYQRNIYAGLNHTIGVSILGGWIHHRTQLNPRTRLFLRGMLDILVGGIVERTNIATRGVNHFVAYWRPSAQVEVGLDYAERFRVVLGQSAFAGLGSNVTQEGGANVVNAASAFYSETSATLSVGVTQHLQVFTRGSYALFAMNQRDERTGVTDSDNGASWQLLIGVGGEW